MQSRSPNIYTDSDMDAIWSEKAIELEEAAIRSMPDTNLMKSDSPLFISMLKMCSVIKGSGKRTKSLDEIYFLIVGIAREGVNNRLSGLGEKEIMRQLKNAYNISKPRYRAVTGGDKIKERY